MKTPNDDHIVGVIAGLFVGCLIGAGITFMVLIRDDKPTIAPIEDIAYHVCMIERERYYEACPETNTACAWTGCTLHSDFE